MRKYYVYKIFDVDTKECIYIGKGSSSRVYRQVFNINGFDRVNFFYSEGGNVDSLFEIIHERLTESEAFNLEKSEIVKYRTIYELKNKRTFMPERKSEEWKRKISESNKKVFSKRDNSDRKGGNNNNAVKCIYLPTDEEFDCLKSLCDARGFSYSSVKTALSNVKNGRAKKSKYKSLIKFQNEQK